MKKKIIIKKKATQAIVTRYGVGLWLNTKTKKIKGNW